MKFVRPFSDVKPRATGNPGHSSAFLSQLESGIFIHAHVDPGGCGPALHYHESDQIYYLLEGEMEVQLGFEQHHVSAGSLVFIPAGTAPRNWNASPQRERHVELIVPTPRAGAPLAIAVDDPDDVPASARARFPAFVRRVDTSRLDERRPGFSVQPLADPSSGSLHAIVNYAEVAPGGAGPSMHIHKFDQYYVVLDGELTVEVALEKHLARAGTLVILPAGVPHCQYNSGTTTEKHLAVLSPTPTPGEPWDLGVEITPTGESHVGPNELAPAASYVGGGRLPAQQSAYFGAESENAGTPL